MDVIRQQLKRSKQERDEIERQLPNSAGQWELELKDAELALARIEELVPLENRVHTTRASLEEMRRRVNNQQRKVEMAEKAWRGELRTTGLPESLEPHQLRELSHRANRIAGFHDRLDQYKLELAERRKELATLRDRFDTLIRDCGIQNEAKDLLTRLNQLTAALNEQRLLVGSRKEYVANYQALRAKLARCHREHDKSVGQKNRLLNAVGADSEDEYRKFELKINQRDQLSAKRTNLSDQINAALGTQFVEADVEPHLEAYGQAGLEKQLETVQFEIEELKDLQSKLHQQKGELQQELKLLGEDVRLDEAKLELNCVDAEITHKKRRWQVLATSSLILESIREKYEAKRQPETLKEASTYLSRLTDGKYTRIWTRLIGEELLVDNADEESITVEKLSRGTREAVYLSLRLALIGAFARRGALLPMVMDDVLVNFDSQRARAAAELLCDFSRKGYQLLMFTCHEHMRDLFDSFGVDVKILPHHRDVAQSQATAVVYRREPAKTLDSPPPVPPSSEPVPIANLAKATLRLQADPYDPELEFELAAVGDHSKAAISSLETQGTTASDAHRLLRHDLIYRSPNRDLSIRLDDAGLPWSPAPNAQITRAG
jgi:uncharacterized protein YhaN